MCKFKNKGECFLLSKKKNCKKKWSCVWNKSDKDCIHHKFNGLNTCEEINDKIVCKKIKNLSGCKWKDKVCKTTTCSKYHNNKKKCKKYNCIYKNKFCF